MDKILIIGFGKMGNSHFNSFYRKKYIIHIIENKFNTNIKKIITNKFINKTIFIYKTIPTKKNYLLTICATRSKERFRLIKRFLERNKTKFLLLEKFCFSKLEYFIEFNRKFNNRTRTFINSWGYILAKEISLQNKKNLNVVCNIKEGLLLNNISHIFHLFNYLNNRSPLKKLQSDNYKIIKNIKRKEYDELKGSIIATDSNKNKLIIETKKRMSDIMTFNIYEKNLKLNYKLSIKKNNTVHYFKSGQKIKVIKFPFSSITSLKFLKKKIKDKLVYLPSFNNDYKISKLILNKFKVKIP